jgi:hypothetical protein
VCVLMTDRPPSADADRYVRDPLPRLYQLLDEDSCELLNFADESEVCGAVGRNAATGRGSP